MRAEKIDFLLTGVGGQGVLTASDIVAEAGLAAGYDVKKSEVHGFSQRGGAVDSHVRWGRQVFAPLAEKGAVDCLLAFELMEAARWVEFLRPGAIAIVNTQQLVPMSVSTGDQRYPEQAEVVAALEQITGDVRLVDGLGIAESMGNPRLANTALLGALSLRLAIDAAIWLAVIERRVPARHVEANHRAFWAGRGL